MRLVRVATVFRHATAGRHRFRLTERAVRHLRPGPYAVRIRVGTSRRALGPVVQRAFVKHARPGRG